MKSTLFIGRFQTSSTFAGKGYRENETTGSTDIRIISARLASPVERLAYNNLIWVAEIAMIEAAKIKEPVYDVDNPDIDPETTPEQFEALMRAVGERNRRNIRMGKELACHVYDMLKA